MKLEKAQKVCSPLRSQGCDECKAAAQRANAFEGASVAMKLGQDLGK